MMGGGVVVEVDEWQFVNLTLLNALECYEKFSWHNYYVLIQFWCISLLTSVLHMKGDKPYSFGLGCAARIFQTHPFLRSLAISFDSDCIFVGYYTL
jgi:hypothetical protein